MVKAAVTAKFPAALVTQSDVGIFSNYEGVTLSSNAGSGDTVFNTEQAPSNLEADMWLLVDGPNGWEVVQVDAVDAGSKTVTVERSKDGTTAVQHLANHALQAVIPAQALNQIRVELIAIETHLGINGGTINWDRALQLRYTGTGTTPTLSIGRVSGTADPEPFLAFERSTDGGANWTTVGDVVYDPTNDELEFRNIVLTVAAGAHFLLEDDRELRLGTGSDGVFKFNAASGDVEYAGVDIDLGGTILQDYRSPITTKTANYTALANDETILGDAAAVGSFTVTLPTASGIPGKLYVIKKIDSGTNTVTVDPNGAETIDGLTTVVLRDENEFVVVRSDGTNWEAVS